MINIITSFYISNLNGNNIERNNELREALNKNIQNNFVEKIHLFVDDEEAKEYILSLNSEKINIIRIGAKPTYSELFDYAEVNLKDKICMVTNSDIYLYEFDMKLINKLDDCNTIFCLTRYEYDLSCPLIKKYTGSHDSFIFKSPLTRTFIDKINHYQHNWGSENVLMYELKNAGIKIHNPCHQIKIVHLHASDLREDNRIRINKSGRNHIYKPDIL